eukprot:156235-Pelagomonas_calceolata.AAC.2
MLTHLKSSSTSSMAPHALARPLDSMPDALLLLEADRKRRKRYRAYTIPDKGGLIRAGDTHESRVGFCT